MTTRAGLPTTTVLAGTSEITTEPAPITELSPILIPPIITEFAYKTTLLPIEGILFPFINFPAPIVTF